MENEVAKISKGCNAGFGKIIGIIFFAAEPTIHESKTLDPITEDADFEVIEKIIPQLPNPNVLVTNA